MSLAPSSIAAFLRALTSSSTRPTDPPLDFDSGINTSSAYNDSLPLPPEGVLRSSLAIGTLSRRPPPNINAFSDDEHEDDDDGPNAGSSGFHVRETESGGGDDIGDDSGFGDIDKMSGRPARALYGFQGKPEFRELTSVAAGDELEVLKEEAGEGWSLVRHMVSNEGHRPEVGLLPESYYTFTSDFTQVADLELSPSLKPRREPSDSSITPRGSPSRQPDSLPLIPQNTGEWLPSFRRSLLGGRSLNRFSNFVTSGAEAFVLQGTGVEDSDVSPAGGAQQHERIESTASVRDEPKEVVATVGGEAERHYVEAGPAWKPKVPPFRILVHSPSKRNSGLSGAYTIYAVTSLFDPPASSLSPSSPGPSYQRLPSSDTYTSSRSDEEDDNNGHSSRPGSPVRITVHRRFSHFVVLHTALARRLPGIALPPLPEKQYAGRFNADFVEARRGDLERYLSRVVRHPIARYAEVLTFFLGCESDFEWKKHYPLYLSLPPAGPTFFANVYHPAFNLDTDEASEVVDRFVNHTKTVGKGVQVLRNVFNDIRQASVEMSKAQRLLSYSLLSLITSKPLAASASTAGINEADEDVEEQEEDPKLKGHVNSDGAWCWREDCDDCLRLTKAMQRTTEVLQGVADLYDDHARRTQLATHEALKGVAHPAPLYAGVVETHQSTLSRYNDATIHGAENEDVAARCETVLNTTMAEVETYHTQKVEDFQALTKGFLDDEIALYEQILTRLKSARRTFTPHTYTQLSTSPRQPSIYERDLDPHPHPSHLHHSRHNRQYHRQPQKLRQLPRLNPPPLTQPCPHVYDSAPMRPVSVAIQEGVSMLLGGRSDAPGSPSTLGRSSILGRFW